MLGFILSKMQMMLFATGVLIVLLLFYNFISGMEVNELLDSSLQVNANIIINQKNDSSSCSWNSINIPDFFRYGLNGSTRLYYDLVFSKEQITNPQGQTYNLMILSILEHGKEQVLAAKGIALNEEILLVDPAFIAEDDKITDSIYDRSSISLYPRARATGPQASAPNSFVALKETKDGKSTIFIIPCSTMRNESPSNCVMNILRVGCYKLYIEKNKSPLDTDKVPVCFDVIRETESGNFIKGMTWKQCQEEGLFRAG